MSKEGVMKGSGGNEIRGTAEASEHTAIAAEETVRASAFQYSNCHLVMQTVKKQTGHMRPEGPLNSKSIKTN